MGQQNPNFLQLQQSKFDVYLLKYIFGDVQYLLNTFLDRSTLTLGPLIPFKRFKRDEVINGVLQKISKMSTLKILLSFW